MSGSYKTPKIDQDLESGKPPEAEGGIGAAEKTIHGLSLADRGVRGESEPENLSLAVSK